MCFQFLSKSISKNKMFLRLQQVDHFTNCWKRPLVVSSSWQFLDNFPVLVMQFKVNVHVECQTDQDSLTKLQRKLEQSEVLGRNCDS